ncbi:hypothetical protein [Microbacterium sp. H6]|uniref:hypothetical protein n=1 Tax=Microbacterium sp. H6 TaxID=421122 RepID=UPI000DE45C00|nr:hypothetical protein [Microbacterium sp. H6]RBO73507.1 hypothetical protein DSP71_04950 [Microbacterium sp. H6]
MNDKKKLIERLRAVIDTATSDSMLVENDRVVTNAEHDACRAERDEAEAVRDLVIAALTSTDDEREALVAILEAPLTEESQGRTFSEMLADVILVRFGFRRTEVPEPSVEDYPDAEGLVALRSNGSEPHGEPSGSLTIPRPHVPFGPIGIPEYKADADYLDHAAKSLEGHYEVGGSNVRATVVKLLRDTSTALRAAGGVQGPVKLSENSAQGEPSDAHRALIDAAESMTPDEIHQHPMAALDKLRALARELRAAGGVR